MHKESFIINPNNFGKTMLNRILHLGLILIMAFSDNYYNQFCLRICNYE
jgi:hypothetical protein